MMTWAMSAQTAIDCASPVEDHRPVPPTSPATRSAAAGSIRTGRGDDGAWNELLAQITHNIRTPLNAVIGFADLMHRETYGSLGDDRYRQYAEHIRTSGARLLEVAEETLAMTALATRGYRGDFECLALHDEAAAATRAIATHMDGEGGRPAIDIADDIHIRADGPAFRHALRNIVAAACHRAGGHSGVTIRATCTDGHVVLVISCDGARAGRGFDGEGLETARTLLRLQGIPSRQGQTSNGAWMVSLDLGSPEPAGLFAG